MYLDLEGIERSVCTSAEEIKSRMMARQTRGGRFYSCLWVAFVIVCCVSYKPDGIPDPAVPHPSEESVGTPSESLHVHIYFDATLSMQGFVIPAPTNYTRIRPLLESVALSGWADAQVEFYRFGTHVEPMDRDDYLRVPYPKFYEHSDINKETRIEKVIDHESQEGSDSDDDEGTRLAIIVTDLFQTDGDTNVLVARFKDNYLKNNLEVGILGIRSHFDGVIYDIGVGVPPRPYKSDPEDPSTFRPFYLLVVGRHADISHYFDVLISAGASDARTVIFSPHLTEPLPSFEDGTLDSIENLVRASDISPDPSARVEKLRVRGNPDKAGFSATLRYSPLPHSMIFDPNRLDSSDDLIIAKRCPEMVKDSKAADCLDVTAELKAQQLKINANLTPKDLARNVVYLFEIHLRPEVNGFGIPSWCSAGEDGWDMPSEFDATRTLNLSDFVRSLSQASARIHRPKIGELFFYLQKR